MDVGKGGGAEWLDWRDKGGLASIKDVIQAAGYPEKLCFPNAAGTDILGVGIEHTVNVHAYNTRLVSSQDVPRSLEDLLNPKWSGGRIAIEQGMDYFVEGGEACLGGEQKIADYLKKLGQQKPLFIKGKTPTLTLLSAGEYAIALSINLQLVLIAQQEGSPSLLYPFRLQPIR